MSYVLRTKNPIGGEYNVPIEVQFTDPFDAINAAMDNVTPAQDIYIIDTETGEVVGAMSKSTLATITQDQDRLRATLPNDDEYETLVLPVSK